MVGSVNLQKVKREGEREGGRERGKREREREFFLKRAK